MTANNLQVPEFLHKLKPYFPRIEILLAAMALIGLGLQLYKVHAGALLLIFSLALLSIFYVMSSFVPDVDEDANIDAEMKGYILFTAKLSGFSCCILVVGVLFSLMNWPNHQTNLYIGLGGSFVSLLIYVVKLKQHTLVPRLVILMALGLFFVFSNTYSDKNGDKAGKVVPKVYERVR